MKTLKEIHTSRQAAKAISTSVKYFLAKKKYYLTMAKIAPTVYKNSKFLKMLRERRELNET